MAGKLVSREERLTRVRGQLQGTSAVPAGRTASSKGARLLYGVALHGAARRAAGLELTDLEAQLVQMLSAVLTDEEEVRDFGRVYSEEAAGRSHLFPDCLATRPVTEGYAEEDLARDLPDLAAEIAAQANVRVIDLDAAEGTAVRGARTDEEFANAAAALGWGATVVTASGQEPAPTNTPAIHARMSLTKFWCYRESNEWSDSDEIYWAACASADEGAERAVATREYEDVDKGETHYLDPNTIVFEGPVKNSLIVHIECWEKDQGSQAAVQRMLDQMTTRLRTTAEKLALLPLGEWMASDAYSAMAGMLADLAYALIQAAADDWVAGHVFTYDRAALQRLSGTEFKAAPFDDPTRQEGAFDLYARIDVATANVNNIALLTGNGTSWNAPALPWPGSSTPDAPAMAAVGATLYCAHRSGNNRIYVSRRDAGGWSGFGQVPGIASHHAPALAAHNGQLHLAHTGGDGSLYIQSSADGASWSSPLKVQGGAISGPALAVRNSVLHMAYAAPGWGIWFNYSTNAAATAWTGSTRVPDVGTNSAPALASIAGGLHLVYRAAGDNGIYHRNHNGSAWQALTQIPGTTADSPALAMYNNRLYCVVRGSGDNRLYISKTQNETNSIWSPFTPLGSPVTLSGPALAAPNGTDLYLAYRTA